MSRKAAYPPGKVWADESTPYEDAKDCVLALPWAACAICGAALLRTARYRKLSPCCESHGQKCGGFIMMMVSTPIVARTRTLLHDWHAEVYPVMHQAMLEVHAHHERRVENLLLNCLQEQMNFVGPWPQNRKRRRQLRKRGRA